MEKVQRAAPQALVAWGAALRALYAKILRQNELPLGKLRFLASPRLKRGRFYVAEQKEKIRKVI